MTLHVCTVPVVQCTCTSTDATCEQEVPCTLHDLHDPCRRIYLAQMKELSFHPDIIAKIVDNLPLGSTAMASHSIIIS
jgi:hypothetical protein